MTRVISITTDFGSGDFGVGEMLGVIYSIAGDDIRIADLTHDVPRHNVLDAAVILERHTPYFPPGSVHIAVIDPGVGTGRRPIAARLGDQIFVGPDNGLLTLMLQRCRRLGEGVQVVHTSNPAYWLPQVSAIFHGRDIFAAVAAHIARGVPLEALGEPVDDPVLLDISQPLAVDGGWQGTITRVDHFGNLESNIDGSLTTGIPNPQVLVGGVVINGLVQTFGDAQPGDLVAMIDSSGVLGVSVVNGSAAQRLNAGQGTPITLRQAE